MELQTTIYKWLAINWMIPNLYIGKWLEITKHPFLNGWPWGSRWVVVPNIVFCCYPYGYPKPWGNDAI